MLSELRDAKSNIENLKKAAKKVNLWSVAFRAAFRRMSHAFLAFLILRFEFGMGGVGKFRNARFEMCVSGCVSPHVPCVSGCVSHVRFETLAFRVSIM